MSGAKVPYKPADIKARSPSPTLVKKNPQGETLRQDLPPLPTASPVPGGDMSKRLEELAAKEVRMPSPNGIGGATSLKIDLGAISADALFGPGEAGLRDAKKLFDQSKFREALTVLDRVLKEVPRLDEALYLEGLCYFRLGEFKLALHQLRNISDGSVQTRRRALQAEIREAVTPELTEAFMRLLMDGKLDAAIAEAKQYVDLDPGCGLYNLFYVGGLLSANKLAPARAAVETAVATCRDGHLDSLKALQRDIAYRDLKEHLNDARLAYRQLKYPKARRSLDKMPQVYREAPLWTTLHDYLDSLGGSFFSRGLDPAAVKPVGTRELVNAMYAYLVEEEIDFVNRLLAMRAPEQAIQVAGAALGLAPHYGFGHYLLALSVYRLVQQSWTGEREPLDPDTILDWLTRAREHAQVAATDPTVEHAPACLSAIGTAMSMMRSIKAEIDRQLEEARQVKVLREEFQSIFSLAGEGIASLEHLDQVRQRLKAVGSQAQSLLKNLRVDQVRSYVESLIEAVQQNISQLNNLEPVLREVDQVRDLSDDLVRVLESAKDGLRDQQHHASLTREIGQLQNRATHLRQKLTMDESRKELDGLIEILGARKRELDAAQDQFADEALLRPVLERFKVLMDSVNSHRISADEFRDGLSKLSRKTQQVHGLKTDSARKTLRQLEEAIAARLKEAEEMEAESADAALVKPVMDFFGVIMESAKARNLDADTLREALTGIKQQVNQVRPKVRSSGARDALDKLESVVQGYLDQLRRMR